VFAVTVKTIRPTRLAWLVVVSLLATLLATARWSDKRVEASGPSITPPTAVPVPLNSVVEVGSGAFVINGFDDSATLLVSVALPSSPSGTTLSFPVTTGLTLSHGFSSWADVTSVSFTGTRLNANAALAQLRLRTSGTPGSVTVAVTAMAQVAGVASNPDNGHFYEFISHPNIGVGHAHQFATARTFAGTTGYLVTITSQAEQDFVRYRIAPNATNLWIGASDASSEGQWQWMAGPEASLGSLGLASDFSPWCGGEPNDAGSGEDYAVTIWGGGNCWNDYQQEANIQGYVVEYGNGLGPTQQSFTGVVSANVVLINAVRPSAPATPTVQEGVGQVTLSWVAPTAGSSAITDYVIEYSANSGSSWVTVNDGVNTSATTVVTGLSAGTSYQFRVSAKNNEGTGSPSTPTTALTLSPALAWSSTSPLPGAKWNTAYTQALAVSNGVGSVSYSLVSGSLPTGLNLSGGVISGTPTVRGTSTFTLRATDGRTPASTADREFTMQVVRGSRSPALQSPGSSHVSLGSLAINTQRRSLTRSGNTMSHTAGSQGGASYSYQTDQTYSGASLREGDQRGHSLSFNSDNSTSFDGRSAVSLSSSGNCNDGNAFTSTNAYGVSINATTFCSVFGPQVWSNSFEADSGEALSFRWAAAGGGDDYETYAFLVNTANNAHTVLAYGRGLTQGWTVASGVIPADGTYRFRFVNGTYDKSGGLYLGATMYVDPTITVGSTQTITFPALAAQGVGASLDLSGTVTATSGLTPALTSNSTGVCTASGLVVNFLAAGTCSLTANQAGNTLFVPAASVTRTLTVGVLQNQTITFATQPDRTYGDAPASVSATATSGLPVEVTSVEPEVCRMDDGTLTLLGVGTCELLAYQNGGGSFAAAPDVSRSFTVNPKPLSVAGVTGVDRPYDGGTNIAVTGTPILVGVVGSDSVNLTGSATGALHTPAAGVGRAVTVSGLALAGTHADRYVLTTTMSTATVSPLTVTVALVAGLTNQYDGDTTFTLSAPNYQVSGVLGGESITVTTTTGSLDERHAGTRTVTASALTYAPGAGTSLANYTLPTQVVGDVAVTPKPLTLSGVTPVARHYDGTTVAAITGTSLVGVTGGDTVNIDPDSDGSLDSPGAGSRTLTTRVSITGPHVGNYTVTQTTAPITITPRPITAALSAGLTRVYDRTTTFALTPSGYTIGNVVGGESMTITNTTVTLSARQVGTYQATVSSLVFAPGVGTSLANYALPSQATGSVSITPKTVTVRSAQVEHRPYDGSRDVTVTDDGLVGVVDGDVVRLANTGLGVVPSADVGDYPVTVTTTMSLVGLDVQNYALSLPSLRVMITPQPLRVSLAEGLEKIYDGNTAFPVTSGDVVVDGVIPGQRITVRAATGTLDSRNAGDRTVTVNAPQYVAGGNTTLTNYQMPGQFSGRVTVRPFVLNVDSAQVTTRRYDGSIVAVITGATLRGVIGTDRVWLDAAATGTFSVPNVARRVPVTTSMRLGGTDAGNYSLLQPVLVGEITRAPASVALSGSLVQETDGTAKFLIGDTAPSGLAHRVTYNGAPLAPSTPGTYAVVATITDPNYEAARATATLVLVAPTAVTTSAVPGSGGTTSAPVSVPATPPVSTTTTTVPTTPAVTASSTTVPADEAGAASDGDASATGDADTGAGTGADPEAAPSRTGIIDGIEFVAPATLTEEPTIAPVVQRPDGTPVDLAPMETYATVNGEPAEGTTMTVVDARRASFDLGGSSLDLSAESADGQPTVLDANGNLVLDRDGLVAVGGDGFKPGSRAEVWMFSTPVFLGFAEVAADGTFAAELPLQGLLALGEHTVQANGIGPSDEQWSVSMGVVVAEPATAAAGAVAATSTDVGTPQAAVDQDDGGVPTALVVVLVLVLALALVGGGVLLIAPRVRRVRS